MEKIFSEIDLQQIVKRGNSLEKIMQQLHYFKNGIPNINLHKIASINDGIFQFSEPEVAEFCMYFDKHKDKYTIEKFVPASGAATRMFKSLNEFLNSFNPEKEVISLRIPIEILRDIDNKSATIGISRNEMINQMIVYALRNMDDTLSE